MISIHIGSHQHVRSRLAGRIWTVRRIGRRLIKIAAVLLQGTIHLIRGHMQEFPVFLKAAVRQLPRRPGTIQHHRRAQHIGLHKHLRIPDTPVHMTLRCKMHHPVDLVSRKYRCNGLFIADIRFDKRIILLPLKFLQILQIPRIGQCVHVDDPDLFTVFAKHIMNIVGSDKTGSSRYKISPHSQLLSFLNIPYIILPQGTKMQPLIVKITDIHIHVPFNTADLSFG